eukprot:4951753-Amphidinium_carterae.2
MEHAREWRHFQYKPGLTQRSCGAFDAGVWPQHFALPKEGASKQGERRAIALFPMLYRPWGMGGN